MTALGALMFLIFLTLKLVGQIDWSWWLVTIPIWGGLILDVLLALGVVFAFSRSPGKVRFGMVGR